jgi:formylmethanofuran dehydrogenase subunit D
MAAHELFVLIPGRTSRQGCGISEGKLRSEDYRQEITSLYMAPQDMARLGLQDGDMVRVRSEFGQIEVAVAAAKADELPPGVLFIAYGDLSSRLMGADTHGSGMPTSKGLDVTLEKMEPGGSAQHKQD